MVAVKLASNVCLPLGAPTGIRTLVLALKGLRPGPLDDGGVLIERGDFTIAISVGQGNTSRLGRVCFL